MKTFSVNLFKIIVLSFINPQFILALFNTADQFFAINSVMTFLMAFLQAVVIYILISMHNVQSKGMLLWRVLLIFYGTTFLQANIEAILFLKYMQDTMSDVQIYGMLLSGILSAVVVVPAGILLFWKEKEMVSQIKFSLKANLLRGVLLSVLYVVIYIVFGALVFKPIAGEHFDTYYGQLQIPSWLFPFQVLRGGLWTLLAWGTMSIITGTRTQIIGAIAATLAIPITSLLFPVNDVMPAPIRLGHFVEISTSMLLFGFLAGWLLTRPNVSQGIGS